MHGSDDETTAKKRLSAFQQRTMTENTVSYLRKKAVASLDGVGGGGPPRVTPSRGLHPKEKIL